MLIAVVTDSSRHSYFNHASTSDSSDASRMPSLLLVALLAGDLAFMVVHWFHVSFGTPGSEMWSIERDRSFPEMFQYLKYAGIVLALADLFRRTRLFVLLGWIGVFTFLLLDDSMRIHERFGLHLAAWAHIPDFGGLRGRDVGELVYAALGAVVLMPALVLAYVRCSPAARAVSADLAFLLATLVACAVGGDAVHRLLSTTAINTIAGMVEDGGEMLVLSVTCFYVAQWIPDGAHARCVRFQPGVRLLTLAMRAMA